jgi:hypothetical protein
MSVAIDNAKQREAEQKIIEAVKVQCNKLLESMRPVQPAEAERIKTRLEETMKCCAKLPMDFTRKVQSDARAHECTSNTRAAAVALQAAMTKAKEDDMNERNRLVGQAREYANKAISLGADASFRSTLNRKIEIIMMSGNVAQKGPTLAKPVSAVPKSA